MIPLTIAGSDPSGGAGLQLDLKVFLALGFSGAAVPTALTAQSPARVGEVWAVPPRRLAAQLEVLLTDVEIGAVKVGLLPGRAAVSVVAEALGALARRRVPIVVDPVLASSSGARFLPERDVGAWRRELLPIATLVTPNTREAAELAGLDVGRVGADFAQRVAEPLLEAGARAVLVTGGHARGARATDVLVTRSATQSFEVPRVPRRRAVHGTGCALSSAIAARLLEGRGLADAVRDAKAFVTAAIRDARRVGRGARVLGFAGGAGTTGER